MKAKIICTTLLVENSPQALPLGAACIAAAINHHPLTKDFCKATLIDFNPEDDDFKTRSSSTHTAASWICSILMKEFEKALKDESFGEVSRIIENSRKMLKATVNGDIKTVEKILHDIHNSEIPILQYNDENSLSCVLTLAYLSARDTYRVEREEKTGKGYADFAFHPRRKRDMAFIVELKKDENVDVALKQIKEKEYVQKFKNENNEVLAVAICYDSKLKEHKCKIEKI